MSTREAILLGLIFYVVGALESWLVAAWYFGGAR